MQNDWFIPLPSSLFRKYRQIDSFTIPKLYEMFLLVEWTEENMFSVISYRAVETPRKEYSEYADGEDVTARFNGKKYPARIVKKSESKADLEMELHNAKSGFQLPAVSANVTQNVDTGASRPRSSSTVSANPTQNVATTGASRPRSSSNDRQKLTKVVTARPMLEEGQKPKAEEKNSNKEEKPEALKKKKVGKRKYESDSSGDEQQPQPKKKKVERMSEEAKKEKAEKNKKKKETEQIRDEALNDVARDVLGLHMISDQGMKSHIPGPSMDSLSDINQKLENLTNQVKSISENWELMQNINMKLDILLDCKDCMRRAYKSIDRTKQPQSTNDAKASLFKTPTSTVSKSRMHLDFLSSPTPTTSTKVVTSTPKVPVPEIQQVKAPEEDILQEEASSTPNTRASTVDKTSSSTTPTDANTSSTSTPNHSSIAVANVTMQEQNQQPEDGSEDASMNSSRNNDIDELAFVGDARNGISIRRTDLLRCRAGAKTADKLALNLVEFVLSNEEIKTCTIYGNKQHNFKAIPEDKKQAIKSEIFSRFLKEISIEDKTKEWGKITVIMNDKIRKLRKKLD